MEPGAGTAGNGDKQHGQQGLAVHGAVHAFEVERGILHGVAAEERAAQTDRNGDVEEPAAQVAARLQQQPHGREGRDEAIDENDDVPLFGADAGDPFKQGCGHTGAKPYDAKEQRQEDGGSEAQRHLEDPQAHAHCHAEDQVQPAGHGDPGARGGILGDILEGLRSDVGKGDDHVDQRQPDEGEEEYLAEGRHVAAGEFAHGRSLVADAGGEAGHVMHTAHHDGSHHNPHQRGQPAKPQPRQHWPHYGPGRGNGREMLAEQQGRFRGDKVLTVVDLLRGGYSGIIEPQLPRQVAAIDHIGNAKEHSRAQYHQRYHRMPLDSFRRR